MKFFNTPHERKSAVLTSIIVLLLLLFFSWVGLSYFDPPIRYGMEVNFGSSSVGSGKVQPKVKVTPPPKAQQNTSSPISKTSPKTATPKVLTQEDSDVPVVKKEKKAKKKTPETKKDLPTKKPVETPKKIKPEPPKPKVDASTKNVLSNLLKGKPQSTPTTQGEGDDREAGDKGKQEGNPYASSYYGAAGMGGKGSGYGLNGRNLQANGSVTQECNQEGVVVVRIVVNRDGQVIDANPGVKGSTNVHPCLLEPARKTAFLHRWSPDTNAPSKQVGFVVINFKLGE